MIHVKGKASYGDDMQIVRQKLINCPCCKSDFFIRYRDEFYTVPLSDEQRKFLEERREREECDNVKNLFIT